MLIRNNTLSPHIVPRYVDGQHAGDVLIMPGVVEVDAEIWAALVEKDVTFQHYVETGAFEELEAAGPGKMRELPALKLIKDTVVDELLARWEKGEKRPKILKAIKEQREKLVLKAPEPKADAPLTDEERATVK